MRPEPHQSQCIMVIRQIYGCRMRSPPTLARPPPPPPPSAGPPPPPSPCGLGPPPSRRGGEGAERSEAGEGLPASPSDGQEIRSIQSAYLASEDRLLEDRVDTPIGVDHLGHAKIDRDRHQRDRLVLAEPLCRHQEMPHLAESVAHRAVERGLGEDLGLCVVAEFGQIVRKAEAVHHPLVLCLQQWIVEID